MKTKTILFIVLLLLATACKPEQTSWKAYFSPKGGCTEAVVREIEGAKISILVQAYEFSSAPIADAIFLAFKKGVKVKVILDKSNVTEKYSAATFLQNHQIPVWIDRKHAINHNKVMVVDDAIVITGSFNFTKKAEESNAENLLVIKSKELAKKYTENWEEHKEHSLHFGR